MAKNPDPKYGRYILPFVIAGLVAATVIFVNALEPGTVPDGLTTTTRASVTPETTIPATTTTTTTLPPVLDSYLSTLEGFVGEGETLLERARGINASWEARSISFGDTEDSLRLLATDSEDFATRVQAAATIPELEASHFAMSDAAVAMATEGQNMVTGLLDPDSAAGRIAAFEAYQLATDALRAGFEAVKARAVEVADAIAGNGA